MRLLVITQKIDKNDTVLGFFHGWVVELSKKVDSIEVICLEKGSYDLPKNVTVYSLGKEKGVSKIGYVYNFYKYLNLISGSYDKVFVHMNQEYILLAGLYWKIKNIPVFLWRNHPAGSFLTQISIFLSEKVFCTSKHSFTAKYEKVVIMPAGIDTGVFKPYPTAVRKKYSICMVGRLAPIKHNDLAIYAMQELVSSGVQASLTILGSFLERDRLYVESIKKYVEDNNLSSVISFLPGVEMSKLPEIYSSHEICINLTDSGSFDKTIVEAAACGAIPLVSNSSLRGMLPDSCIVEPDKKSIADSIQKLIQPHKRVEVQKDLENLVASQSLASLISKIFLEIN